MYPAIHLFGLNLQTYGLMSVVAMCGSILVVAAEAKRLGWDVRESINLTIRCTLLGFVGAHLMYVITMLDRPASEIWSILWHMNVGYVWYGGFLLSWAYCHWYAHRHKIPALQMWDVAAFAVIVALGIGRWACFFNGCCFGKESDLPWAVTLQGVHRHPSPLYESGYQLLMFALLWSLRKKHKRDGWTAALYLILAPIGRFLIEFTRGDDVRGFVVGWLSTSQFIALPLIAAGVALALRLKSLGAGNRLGLR